MVQGEVDRFWQATGGGASPAITLSAEPPADRSAFRVATAASSSCAAVAAAIAELSGRSTATIDPALALASYTTHVRLDGEAPPKWASLSGTYRTADDRFVQLHCNFPHHAAGTAARLGVPEERRALERAVADWKAEELEGALIDDGMIAAVCRTLEEWDDHPHARATADLPLVTTTELAQSTAEGPRGPDGAPLAGVRVLDCSRVLAGPVAGQTLAALGADVLRVGASHLPSVELCVLATGAGKRNADIDLRTAAGRRSFADLVRDADVVIDAYRPGALEGHGFGADDVARINPGCSVVQVSAFDRVGPWADRRGYDSIVQSTTGIAMEGGRLTGEAGPVPLPVQALDYATGYFAAAAAIRAVRRRRREGVSTDSRLSLLRTRNWLVALGAPRSFTPRAIDVAADQLCSLDSDFGPLEVVRPVLGEWRWGPRRLGTAEPTWEPA